MRESIDEKALVAQIKSKAKLMSDADKVVRVQDFYAKNDLTADETREVVTILLGHSPAVEGDPKSRRIHSDRSCSISPTTRTAHWPRSRRRCRSRTKTA